VKIERQKGKEWTLLSIVKMPSSEQQGFWINVMVAWVYFGNKKDSLKPIPFSLLAPAGLSSHLLAFN